MEDDQQFCLRWNNHQSTLISVFDTLLENQTLVDCTLAAEGQFLKAHKVVLSACSPFFATLLQQQYDKHPIFILKDVKYQELRAMMDYMYRGEVNISQDQLAALLKAAESLQIKGLSDNRSGSTPKTEQHRGLNVPGSGSSIGGGGKLSGYTLEQTQSKRPRIGPSPMETADITGSREGSSSPSRRRRKVRRRSVENAMSDVHDNSNSSQINQSSLQPQQQPQSNASLTGVGAIAATSSSIPVSASALSTGSSGVLAATGSIVSTQGTTQQMTTNITKKTESVKGASDAMNSENIPTVGVVGTGDEQNVEHVKGDKSNHKQKSSSTAAGVVGKETAEMVIEPKSEYEEEGNDETVEDLTLDDEEMGMDDLDQNAGTSQAGEGSSQGYAPWQHDRSQDDLLLAPQEAQQRDPQDLRTLYNIATAAAAVVAAASASSNAPVHMHNNCNNNNNNNNNNKSGSNNSNNNNSNSNTTNKKQRHSSISISNERNECANKPNELLATKSRLSNAPTPPTLSPGTSMQSLLGDVHEPEISIRAMYKCCGKRFLQQAQQQQQQQQQQHLHIMQPHALANVATATATITTPPPPPSLATTTTSGVALPTHASNTSAVVTPTSSTHPSNCSGCQITAAASIQLANLLGGSMLLPPTAVAAAAMQDVASKAAAAAVNVAGGEHKHLPAAEQLLCHSALETASSANASLVAPPPHTPATAATKRANVQFHCEFCAFACSWRYDLKLHLRQKHGIHNKKM